MNKYSEQPSRHNLMRRNWLFEVEPFSRTEEKSFGELVDGLRLKRFLKRAVEKDFAPQSLIDSIKNGIRR
jgi:hypothetical protein